MNVAACMKTNVVAIKSTTTIRAAAALFVQKHIGVLPIVDEAGRPLGVVGLRDLLSLELPDFVNFIADVDYVHDFGAVETTRPAAAALNASITSLMEPAITVDEECGLLRAYALLLQHDLHDILVVSADGRLAGIASRVDIGVAILSAWEKVE